MESTGYSIFVKKTGLLLFSLIIVLVYGVHDYFYRLFSRFIRFSDIDGFIVLADIWPWYYSLIGIIAILIWVVFFIRNINKNRAQLGFGMSMLVITMLLLIRPPGWVDDLAQKYRPTDNFAMRDSVQNNGRLFTAWTTHANMKKAHSKLKSLNNEQKQVDNSPAFNITNKNNIHLVVLESFIDTRLLAGISQQHRAGNELLDIIDTFVSASISPAFGGGTPNAEFEVLCGLPSLAVFHSLEFEMFTGSPTNCLPNLLSDKGYHSIASHPYKSTTFNRWRAYESLGFNDANFAYGDTQDNPMQIKLDDMDGIWLFDGSLYDQNLKMVKSLLKEDKPLFNYVLTAGGHYPFVLNTAKRPFVVPNDSNDETISLLVNHFHYRAMALKNYIDALSKLDPEAIIIAISDHLPPNINYQQLEYTSHQSKEAILQIKENLLFVYKNKSWHSLGLMRHKDIFFLILNFLTDNQYCRDRNCHMKDYYAQNNKGRYMNSYLDVMSRAMQ